MTSDRLCCSTRSTPSGLHLLRGGDCYITVSVTRLTLPTTSLDLAFVLAAFRRLQLLPRQRLKKLLPTEAFLKWRALQNTKANASLFFPPFNLFLEGYITEGKNTSMMHNLYRKLRSR